MKKKKFKVALIDEYFVSLIEKVINEINEKK